MTGYWVVFGLIAAIVVAVIYLVRRASKKSGPEPLKTVDLPLWDEEEPPRPHELKLDDAEEDTAPAVLSPPEWKPPPKAASNGPRR